jgi:hypothetical protein
VLGKSEVGDKLCVLSILNLPYHEIKKKEINLGIFIKPTQPFWEALGAENRVLPG